MAKLGLNSLPDSVGRGDDLLSSHRAVWKPFGVTVDWSTVAAVSGADLTVSDGCVVKVGDKCLVPGQVLTQITASGKYGPYDPAAGDGRQTLARGAFGLVNSLVVLSELATVDEEHLGVLEGGRVFRSRLKATSGTHSLANGPTYAELEAVAPLLSYTPDA